MKTDTLVTLRTAVKSFGERTVLDIPLKEFKRGRFYVVQGKNGAGKSTLLRLIAGLELPTVGMIEHETDIRDRGFCFQKPFLFKGTVEDNIAWGLRLRRLKRKVIDKAVKESAERFAISNLLSREVCDLSGGEAQKTALARTTVLSPTLLLLDEPSANLDEQGLDSLRAEIQKLTERNGTCICTTHGSLLGENFPTTVLCLDQGLLVCSERTTSDDR